MYPGSLIARSIRALPCLKRDWIRWSSASVPSQFNHLNDLGCDSRSRSLATASMVRNTSSRGPVNDSTMLLKSVAAVSTCPFVSTVTLAVELAAASRTAVDAREVYLRMRPKRVSIEREYWGSAWISSIIYDESSISTTTACTVELTALNRSIAASLTSVGRSSSV